MQKNWQEFQKNVLGRRKHNAAASNALLLIGGTAVGVAAGLLLAPDNGKATRSRLVESTRLGIDQGRAKMLEMKAALRAKMNRASEQTQSVVEESRQTMRQSRATPQAPAAM